LRFGNSADAFVEATTPSAAVTSEVASRCVTWKRWIFDGFGAAAAGAARSSSAARARRTRRMRGSSAADPPARIALS
jgi:hypothetical protein